MIHLHNFTTHVRTTLLYTFVTAVFTWAIRAVKALATWQTHTFWVTNFGISYEPTHCDTIQSYVACNALQRTATHCHILQHTETHFKNTARYYKGLQYTLRERMTFWATNFGISHEPTLYNTMKCYFAYNTLRRTVTHYHILQYTETHFKNTAEHCKGLQHTTQRENDPYLLHNNSSLLTLVTIPSTIVTDTTLLNTSTDHLTTPHGVPRTVLEDPFVLKKA